MNAHTILTALGDIEETFIAQATETTPTFRRHRLRGKKIAAIAAALVLLVGICLPILHLTTAIPLSDASTGVTARKTIFAPTIQTESCLVGMTEQELFTTFDTAIFRGKILSLTNIALRFNGRTEYRAIASIRVEKSFRGPFSPGETAEILLPCSVGKGIQQTAADTVYAMEVGMEGIFMPAIYDDDDTFATNGATLALADLAPSGFPDGVRYAFLAGENGLIFDRSAYPSLSQAESLEDVETFIQSMMK